MDCERNCQDTVLNDVKVVCLGPKDNSLHTHRIINNKYKDICKEQQHIATIAYNNFPGWFEVKKDGTMVNYPPAPITGEHSELTYTHEILNTFFYNYHVTPNWINCNSTWGTFDDETGHWTGAVGKVNIPYMQGEYTGGHGFIPFVCSTNHSKAKRANVIFTGDKV